MDAGTRIRTDNGDMLLGDLVDACWQDWGLFEQRMVCDGRLPEIPGEFWLHDHIRLITLEEVAIMLRLAGRG